MECFHANGVVPHSPGLPPATLGNGISTGTFYRNAVASSRTRLRCDETPLGYVGNGWVRLHPQGSSATLGYATEPPCGKDPGKRETTLECFHANGVVPHSPGLPLATLGNRTPAKTSLRQRRCVIGERRRCDGTPLGYMGDGWGRPRPQGSSATLGYVTKPRCGIDTGVGHDKRHRRIGKTH